MFVFIFLLTLVTFLLYRVTRRPSGFPPGPWNLPIFGYLPFLGAEPHKKFVELGKTYGDVFSINFGPFRRLVVLNSYDAIRDAYREDAFAGRPDMYFFHVRGEGYHGVAFNQGPDWQEIRRYTLRVLRDFGFGKSVLESAITNEIMELLTSLKKEGGNAIEPHGRFNLAVLNALWAITTGERIQLDDPNIKSVLKNLRRIISNTNIAGPSIFIPYSKYIPPNLVGVQDFIDQIGYMKDLFQKEIVCQSEKFSKDGQTDNLIKTFVEKIAQTTDETSALYGQKGMKNLVFLVMDLFVAGSETISSTLIWMVFHMALNPDIQERVHKELDDVVGRGRLPNLEDRPHLPLTEAVIMETHRTATLTPLGLPHFTVTDTEFRGYKIPKGTVVMANLYAVHHDPQIWQKPDQFYPQHFLDDQGKLKPVDHLIPFLIGKRSCLGESLARMELFLFATHLLHTFQFSVSQDEAAPLLASTTLIRVPPTFKVKMIIR